MKKLILTAAVVLAAASMYGHRAPKYQPVPVDTAVRVGKLPNGLTYYIRHNDLPKERANFYIAQRVGSILEEENQRGLAHFLEHMAFAGTKNFPDGKLTGYLEQNGIKFGANLNAYTSVDETVYNITDVPTVKPGLVDSCLLILHDWSGFILLEDDAIDRERKVIHEEWRTRSNATLRMYDSLLPKLYPNGNRYASRMPIGLMEVVDNFPYEVLRNYYRKWYRPDLQAIVVVGDIDVDSVEARIKTMWQDIPRHKRAAERKYFPVEDNAEPIAAIATDPEATSSSLAVFYKHDKLTPERMKTTEALDNDYIQSTFSIMLNARLAELTQQADPPYLYAGFGDDDYFLAKTKGAYQLYVAFRDDAWQRTLDAGIGELKRAREYGFTAPEYQRAQAKLASYFENKYNERNKVKNDTYVQECLDNFLENEPLASAEYLYHYYLKRAPEITLDSINDIFRTMFPDHNIALMMMAPSKDSLNFPTEKEFVSAYRKAYEAPVTPYEEKLDEGGFLDREPQAGTVVSEQTDPVFGTTVWTLSNGARVVFKPTDFKSDEILFEAISLGGTSAYGDGDSLYMNFPTGTALVGGLGKFRPTDLQKKLAGKRISYQPYIGSTSEGVSGSCSPKDFSELMQLTHLLFTEPREDTVLFSAWKNQTRTVLANQEANPSITMQDTLNRAIYGNNPRYRRLTPQRLDGYSYDRILELYRQRFANAADFTFIFVGNVDPQSIRPDIERYIASLPGSAQKETARHIEFIVPGNRESRFDKEVSTPKATVVVTISGDERYSLKDQLEMTFLKQIMDIVYVETIRAEEGGTYGVSTQASLLREPYNRYAFTISFDTSNEKSEALADRALAELKKVGDEGPTAAAFDKVKEFLQKSYAQSIKENGYWLGQLTSFYRYGTDSHTEYLKTLNAITPEDIARLAKKISDSPNRVEVVMNGIAKQE